MFWVFQVSGQLKWALCRIQSHGTTHTLRDILQTMQQHLKSWYLFFQGPSASFAVQQWRCVLYDVTIILITSFGNPCPPDWDGTPYFFMWMLILRTRESKMSMGYVAVEGLPCIHNQITLQLFTTAKLVHLNEDRIFWSWWSTSKAICKLGNVCMSLACLLEGVFNCKYLRWNSLTKPLWGYDILYIIRTQLRQLHSCYPL